MQEITYNIGRVESKDCQIHPDGRDDQIQRESMWLIIKETNGVRDQDLECNTPDCQLLGGSHITTLHMMTLHSTCLLVRTLHKLEPFVGSPF